MHENLLENMNENLNKSTGPRTPEGKAIASQNSLKHGLTSSQILIAGEDPEAFESLLNGFEEDYKPSTATEVVLIHDLAKFHWLKNRAIRLQQNAFSDPDNINTKYLELMIRYQNANQRAFANTLKTLLATQKERVRVEKEFVSEQEVELRFGPYPEDEDYVEPQPKSEQEKEEEKAPKRIFLRPPGKLA